jgi:2-methylcitrate dehydratase PrpD
MQAHVEGTVALPLQVAVAARAAVNSIELAGQGLAGPHDVLEGPFGYFKLFEPGGDPSRVMNTLGQPWRITELSHKPFPTGRAAHATLDGVARLMAEHGFSLGQVGAVRANVPPLIARLVARPYRPSMGINYARLCLPYLVGVLLRDGKLDTASFSQDLLGDSQIAGFASRVSCVIDGNPDPNALFPQRVTVTLRSGGEFSIDIPATLGSPDNRLSEEARLAKLHHCFESNGMGATQAEAFERSFEQLEEWPDIRGMLELTRPC